MDRAPAQVPRHCPFCGGAVEVIRLHCRVCDTTFDGHFAHGAFANLTAEQWAFVETFVRCRGKIKDVEVALDLSYPTVVSRLNEVVAALGHDAGPDTPPPPLATANDERRRQLLERLRQGELTPKEALRLLDA